VTSKGLLLILFDLFWDASLGIKIDGFNPVQGEIPLHMSRGGCLLL
jgi:hypothetical protein